MAGESGLVQTYYGDGKDEATVALGLAFWCVGRGWWVVITQFPKNSSCGKLIVAERFSTLVVLRSKGIHKLTFQINDEEEAVATENRRTFFRQAVELARVGDTRLLVLGEVTDAPRGFLPQEEFCAFLNERPVGLEMVLAGRSLPKMLEHRVNYIIHVVKEKHSYDRGVTVCREVEF